MTSSDNLYENLLGSRQESLNGEMSPYYFLHFIKTVKCVSEDTGCAGELGVSDIEDGFLPFFKGA